MTVQENTTASKPRRGKGSGLKTVASTFNPLMVPDANRPQTDEEIVQAYRNAVTALQKADPEKLGGKPFTLSDEQILVTVRSKPGLSDEEKEGMRLNALLSVSGIEHKATDVHVQEQHVRDAQKEAANLPDGVLTTMRKLTEGREFANIAALVVRQILLDDPKHGRDWLRTFPRIGYDEDKPGKDNRTFNSAERFKTQDGERTKYVSAVAATWNETPDGRAQLEQLRLIKLAEAGTEDSIKSPYYGLGMKERADEKNKWTQRNQNSINTFRNAIRIEQLIQDIETTCPNVQVKVKYKSDRQGNDTNEIRNSQRPIIVHQKDNIDKREDFTVKDFVRLLPYKALENLPAEYKAKGPNIVELKTTAAKKGAPNAGQGKGKQAPESTAGMGVKTMPTVDQMLHWLTVQVPNFFDSGQTVEETREYTKRKADLMSKLSAPRADEDVKYVGRSISDLSEWFSPLSLRFNRLIEKEAAATGEEKAA